jgi:hypothetical protein
MITRFRRYASITDYQSCRLSPAALTPLGFSTAPCLGLIALRAWHYRSSVQIWLAWNLFLV